MLTFEGQQSSGGNAIIEKLVVSDIIGAILLSLSLLIRVRALARLSIYRVFLSKRSLTVSALSMLNLLTPPAVLSSSLSLVNSWWVLFFFSFWHVYICHPSNDDTDSWFHRSMRNKTPKCSCKPSTWSLKAPLTGCSMTFSVWSTHNQYSKRE